MKKLMTIFAILFATITFGQSLGDFPVSPNQGGITEAANRQRIADDGGTYLSNIAPHQLDVLTSYGIVPDNLIIPSGRKASVLYSQFPTDGTGDFVVINAAVKNEINSNGLLEEIAANIAGFNYKFGFPVLEVNEATENLIEDPVSIGSNYWTLSGAIIQIDNSTATNERITDSDDRDFTGGDIGNWVVSTTGNGTVTYSTDLDQEAKITVGGTPGSNTRADLSTTNLETLTDGTIYLLSARVYIPSSNNNWTLINIETQGISGGVVMDEQFANLAIEDAWQMIYRVFLIGADVEGNIRIEAISSTTGNICYFDDISVKEVTGFPAPHADSPLDVSAYKLVEDDQNSTHYFTKSSITVTNGVTLTQSIKAKQGERNWIRFEEIESGDGYYFDLENGVVGTEIGTVVNSSITAMSGGYWDISITVTVPSTDAEFRVGLADADNSNSYAGDGSSGLFVAFAQLEELPYASTWTFIAEGSTSSRIADQINNATYIESSEGGTLYAEIAAFADDGTDRYISISDGSVANVIQLYYSSTTNQIVGKIIVGSATQATLTYTLSDETEFAKCLVSWATDNFTLVVNGVERATDPSGSVPAFGVLDEISLDDGAGDNDFYGYIKELASLGITTTTERVNITTQ